MIYKLVIIVSAIKLLLLTAYHSTDFEVHRNWLAVTYSLPISQWYTDTTSEWTLDYPPLFAWFEHCLAQVAQWFDPAMLDVSNLNYCSHATLIFQRLTVVLSDLVMVYAMKGFEKYSEDEEQKGAARYTNCHSHLMFLLVFCNFGLFLVDHIHFQYNGFLFGILLLSLSRIYQGRYIEGATWFAVLLNLKHIFLYVAPAFFVYLLKKYCFDIKHGHQLKLGQFKPVRFIALGAVAISVFVVSFGPFISMGQLSQVLSRLFPFKRGLCHAYWAPNFWALYNIADKILLTIGTKLKLISDMNSTQAAMTGGLVQEYEHAILPAVRPVHTLLLTLVSILPFMFHLWLKPCDFTSLVRGVVMCAYGAFMFGWHVHEKAVLLIVIPLTLLAVKHQHDSDIFLLLSAIGHYSLFPLIFTPAETCIKYALYSLYTVYSFCELDKLHGKHERTKTTGPYRYIRLMEKLYITGLVPVELFYQVHSYTRLATTLPFLPLLLTSVYCALGMTYIWIRLHVRQFTCHTVAASNKTD